MKISKLFHWLYGVLMLAPVFAVGVTCLTHVFNKEVESQTEIVNVSYKYNTNSVSSYSDLVNNNAYLLTINTSDYSSASFLKTKEVHIISDLKNIDIVIGSNDYPNNTTQYTTGVFSVTIDIGRHHYGLCYSNFYYSNLYRIQYINDDYTNTLNIMFVYSDTTTWSNSLDTYNFTISELPLENNTISSVDIDTVSQDEHTNIFYTSCEQVKDSFILNWCDSNNLVREVMNYGSSLFNVPSDNLMNYYLTYWVSVSIIWLVFDVFMYVPLLVHRWLDKAKIE